MNSEGLSAGDILALTKDNRSDEVGGGYFWWVIIFLIIAAMFGGNGFGFGNRGVENALLGEDEFIKRDIFNTNQNVSSTACETQRDVLESSCQTQRDVLENRFNTQLGFANANAQAQNCCCETQKEILQSRYDTALGNQGIQSQMANDALRTQMQLSDCCCRLEAQGLANTQKILDKMCENEINNLRDRLNERDRELQSAQFQISQVNQTSNIVNTLRPYPQPAYITCSPYQSSNYPYGYGYGCGCGVSAVV